MLKYLLTGGGLPWRFLAPDAGGGSGGAGASSGQSGNGAGGEGSGGETIKTPFDDLPWDDLPEEDRTKMEKAKADFVATVQQNQKLSTDLEKTTQQARQFQSRLDRIEAQAKKEQKSKEKADPYLDVVTEELRGAGYTPEQIEAQAPVFARMFQRIGGVHKQEIGADLAPLAGTVLAQQATTAFQDAYASDRLGMFQVEAVSNQVWELVRGRVENNQPTDAQVVLNLAKMVWADHVAEHGMPEGFTPAGGGSGGAGAVLPNQPPIPGMRTGGFARTGGGGGMRPIASPTPEKDAPRHQLNDDTRQALAQTFRSMGSDTGVMPKAFKTAGKGGR